MILISKQDAIDAIVKKTNYDNVDQIKYECSRNYEKNNGWLGGLKEALEVIEEISSAEPERKWIPVTEKLPEEENKSYWVCTDTKYQCECRWTNNIYGIGESNDWGWKIFDIPQYTKVIAWMQLPKPYRGE